MPEMFKRMTWNQWRLGLRVSLLDGLFFGVIGLASDLTWRQELLIICMAIAKKGSEYIAKNPVENIEQTQFIKKEETK